MTKATGSCEHSCQVDRNGDWWEDERVIPIRKVCDLHPRGVHYSTVHRWCTAGLTKYRPALRLQSWKEGNERFTTVEAYRRFVAAQNP